MTQHIGIVACSAEGAALCYRTICIEGTQLLGAHDHPEVSMHTHSLAQYVQHLDLGDWQGVGDLMLSSAHRLASIGADFLVCPDNTIHAAMRFVEPHSPRPWLRPSAAEREQINRIIMDELVYGVFKAEAVSCFSGSSAQCTAVGAMRWCWDAPRFRSS